MDTETSVQAQLLAEAKKQTKALEMLRNMAWFYFALTALAFIVWVFSLMPNG